LDDYEYGIVKKGTQTYKVKQGVAGMSLAEGKLKEEFLGIYLMSKKHQMKFLLYDGEKRFIYELINGFIKPFGLVVYNGGRKAGNEV